MSQHLSLRDGSETQDRRLDRIPAFDQRMLAFPIQDALNSDQSKVITKKWETPGGTPVLDQGAEGACVGFGVTNELSYYPVAIPNLDATFARESIYWVAQEADPWPGGSYPGASPRYEGTSVLYGVKAAADLGYYQEYRWARSERELALGVGYLGPSIIGVDWYEGMFKPAKDGYIRISGEKVGGHCCLVIGINAKSGYYTIHNSWGPSWGKNGTAKLSRKDMATLLNANGEACIVTRRNLPPPVKKTAEKRADAIISD